MKSTTYMVAGQEFELRHYGIKGMKWGVRRARKTAARQAKLHKRQGDDYAAIRDDIKKGDYKKYGYLSDKQARKDLKNWDRMIRDERKIANQWMRTHDELLKMPINDVKNAKQLIKAGRKYTTAVLLRQDRYVMDNAVYKDDA